MARDTKETIQVLRSMASGAIHRAAIELRDTSRAAGYDDNGALCAFVAELADYLGILIPAACVNVAKVKGAEWLSGKTDAHLRDNLRDVCNAIAKSMGKTVAMHAEGKL